MIEAMQLLGLVKTWMEDPLGKHCFWKWCRWAGLKQSAWLCPKQPHSPYNFQP
uniref:Uncharacterized protein n=1 Tax=Anguilla anguilla TaxID=7936 RepID=A0A0E9QJZ6_ANGAN